MDLSPYGQKLGLKARMKEWVEVLRANRGYLGVIADIEIAITLLPDDPPGSPPPPRYAARNQGPAPQPKPAPVQEFDL